MPTISSTPTPAAYWVGGEVSEPVLVTRPIPTVPSSVQRAAGAVGILVFQVTITSEGSVANVRPLRPVPAAAREYQRLYAEAIAAWRYKPALYKGTPVPVILTITVTNNYR